MFGLLSPGTRAAVSDSWALTGVLALWAGMLVLMLGWILVYGQDLPLLEEWYLVPPLTDHEPDLLKWLWQQLNEHRIPVQKAVYLILLKVSGGDYRIGLIANALILGGLTLALIITARHLRGQTHPADTFFPLVLLNLGYVRFFLYGFAMQFTIYIAIVIVWLLIIVRELWPLSQRSAIISGIILMLLPITGASGVLFTSFAALWLAAGAFLYQHHTSPRWIFPYQCACVTISIVMTAFYFIGYSSPSWSARAGLGPVFVTGVRFVGMSLGAIGAGTGRVFPKSIIGIVFCGIGALLWASGIIPFRHGLHRIRTPEGSRFFGFLVFGSAMVALTLSVAWGRAGWVSLFGMPDRYAVLSMPGLCTVYFAWLLYGPRTVRDRVANTFAVAALLALPFNVNQGLVDLNWYVAKTRAFDHDLADGLSWRELADKYCQFLFPFQGGRDTLIDYARMLHDAKIGPFGRAGP